MRWARDHRVHHKYSDTHADPHNSKNGFFFCHIGWLLVRKHSAVIKRGKENDISDLEGDPILVFQHKYYYSMVALCAFFIPIAIPMYFWNETLTNAYFLNMVRFVYSLHATFTINSIAHMWGFRPYDK